MVKLLQLFCVVCEFIQILGEVPGQTSRKKSGHLFFTFQIFKNEVKMHKYLKQQKSCKILILKLYLFHACLSNSA